MTNQSGLKDQVWFFVLEEIQSAKFLLDMKTRDDFFKEKATLHDPSPNTTTAPSQDASLRVKSTRAPGKKLPRVALQPIIQVNPSSVDLMTGEVVHELPEAEQIKLTSAFGETQSFSKEYVLGWINAEVSNGKTLNEIYLQHLNSDGQELNFPLNDNVWITQLLRGPAKVEFIQLWEEEKKLEQSRQAEVTKLKKVPGFLLMAKIFIYDLHKFGSIKICQERLEGTLNEFFLGPPYFTEATVTAILDLPFHNKTVGVTLEYMKTKKGSVDGDGELYASHDLAPLFEKAFQISWQSIKAEPQIAKEAKKLKPAKQKAVGKASLSSENIRPESTITSTIKGTIKKFKKGRGKLDTPKEGSSPAVANMTSQMENLEIEDPEEDDHSN
ncbi:hypothetical protein ABW19_dt0207811 [Dactylella cylindrospora]|nr:hypothetical protein ABW19_dt0207811 [Dactylella cylindrospora]